MEPEDHVDHSAGEAVQRPDASVVEPRSITAGQGMVSLVGTSTVTVLPDTPVPVP